MLAFRVMLVGHAKNAGMKVPDNVEEDFDTNQFPHFYVYSILQLGRRLPYPQAASDNAKVIAKIPEDQIRKITLNELFDLGFV